MPSSIVLSRINLDLLHPGFLRRVLDTVAECEARGESYWAQLGFRTFPEQAKLYFQGRTLPGKVVTNAPPGLSLHNYGLAVDFIHDLDRDRAGLQPDWKEAAYSTLKLVGEKHGLQVGVPGVAGGDVGHVQLPLTGTLGGKERDLLERFKAIYMKAFPKGAVTQPAATLSALSEVWAEVNRLHPEWAA